MSLSNPATKSEGDLPDIKILIKGKNEIKSFTFSVAPSDASGAEVQYRLDQDPNLSVSINLRLSPVFSPDGNIVCLAIENSPLILKDSNTGCSLREINCLDAHSIEFSPKGNYIMTWSPKSSVKAEADSPNLKVWSIHSCEMIAAYSQKQYKKDVIQWTDDELYFAKLVSNEVQIYNGSNISDGIKNRIQMKGVTQFKMSLSSPPSFALFVPESKGNPGRVSIFSYSSSTHESPLNLIASRTLMAATEANIIWNCKSTAVLVHTHCDVDKSNTSYYGTTGLHILTIDGISENVSRSKDGPIHDVKWSPVDNQFIVSAGNMPSHTTLYDGKGTPLYEFGAAHRNTLSYAPHGRFVCIAGFGNLAGDMDFYEITKKMKIGSNNSHCAIKYGWSPDSRYFMTSTLAPRMNVDNGFKVFKYNGVGPVLSHDPGAGPVLFDANWRPAASGTFPDRPRTPVKRSNDSSSDSKANSAPAPPPKPAAYRAPGSTGSLANFMQREEAPKGKVKTNQPTSNPTPTPTYQAKQRVIPGLPPQLATKKVKPVKKDNPVEKVASSTVSTNSSNNPIKPANNVKPKNGEDELKLTTVFKVESAEDKEKRAKNIKKKLKQIEEIKEKQKAGVALNADQENKLNSEDSLLKELKDLSL